MPIRTYRPGDEEAQVRLYNLAAGGLPAFKPANVEEVARRYRASDPDPSSKLYAEEGGQVVGYAVLNPNGRVSYPWCLPGSEGVRGDLLEAVLSELRRRGVREAWAAYRADWAPVLDFFAGHGFSRSREMVNYVAEVSALPTTPVPEGCRLVPATDVGLSRLFPLGRGLFSEGPDALESFFLANPYFEPSSLFALERTSDGEPLGFAVAVVNGAYADPTKLDAAMPCFRLGALGTESERHKRVNGLVSCLFATEQAGEALLSEAALRFSAAGLAHAAAQAPSDQQALCAFYDQFFRRQGAFPIVSKALG
jgi:hypothetical protein